MDILKVNKLTKKFGNFLAVNNIDLTLKEGEILGFLGPNGAGKTTTIQMLLGVLTPSSGEILYFGKNLAKYREEILDQLNFSSTYTNLPWRLTVYENLKFISYLYSVSNRSKKLNEIIEIFKLEDLKNKFMAQLSAGQKTRVNLAKAFLNNPKILLLDEPTASLDPDIAKYILNFIQEKRNQLKVSIIFTSHNMGDVEEICDRVVFINQGKIIANDTPERLAKSITLSHIELMVKDGLKRTISFAKSKKYKYHLDKRFIIIDVPSLHIADFLRELTSKGVHYNEISIQKPSLEDYFLQTATKKI